MIVNSSQANRKFESCFRQMTIEESQQCWFVYVLRGSTDRARLYSYQNPPTPHEKKIKAVYAALVADGRQLAFRSHAVPTRPEAQSLEAAFLRQCVSVHWELPPLNHK